MGLYDQDLEDDEELVAADPYVAAPSIAPAPSPAGLSAEDIENIRQSILANQKPRQYDDKALKEAQQIANKMRLSSSLGEAGSDIGYAIAGVRNPNPGAFAGLQKQAEAPLDQFAAASKLENENLDRQDKTQRAVMDYLAKRNQTGMAQARFDEQKRHNAIVESKPSYAQVIGDVTNQRNDNTVHQKVVEGLKKDKDLNARLSQYKNLDNAMSIITQAKKLTPQQIHEFQQAVRGNLGIKGSGGVGERESTYIDSIGLRGANFQQFLTGDPAEIANDSALVEHLKDLARVEQQNIRAQKEQRIKALTSGYDTVYARRPEFKKDLDSAIQSVGAQFESNVSPRAPQAKNVSPNDQKAIDWAQSHPEDPRAKQILQLHGM